MKPAPASLFFIGLAGFVISVYLVGTGLLDLSWGTAFSLAFLIMFISGVASITPEDNTEYKFDQDDTVERTEKTEEKIPAPARKAAKTKKKKK